MEATNSNTDSLRGGNDYKTERFDVKSYMNELWGADSLHTSQLSRHIIQGLVKAFNTVSIGDHMLDFGCGPSVYSTFIGSLTCKNITLAEFAQQNRNEVFKWMKKDPAAHDWSPFIKHVAELEGSDWKEVEERSRSAIRDVMSCDILQENPLPSASFSSYDVIVSCLCLESACPDIEAYNKAIQKLSMYLKSGGLLVLAGVINESKYPVGMETFHSLHINIEQIEAALQNTGFSETVWDTCSSDSMDSHLEFQASDYYVVHSRKI